MSRTFHVYLLLIIIGYGCTGGGKKTGRDHIHALPVQFIDVAAEVGLTITTVSGTPQKRFIVEGKGGAAAAFLDYDNDGDLDLYSLNGSRLGGFPLGEAPKNRLYRNNLVETGRATFTDVTEQAGVEGGDRPSGSMEGWGMGVTTADYDNDGDQDIFVTNIGPNVLYRNNGDGTFTDATEQAGVSGMREAKHAGLTTKWSTGCAFSDYDRDGDLDLYVANYVDFDVDRWPQDRQTLKWKGIEVMRGPMGLKGAPDILYRNNGDGTFTDVTERAGVVDSKRYYGFAVVWGDYDNDGDPDLLVANDSVPNYLYENRGDGTFTNIAEQAGVAYSQSGMPQAGMGAAFDDYNNDGWLDIFVTHFSEDYNALYRNDRNGFFTDVSFPAGVGQASWMSVGWGTGFIDYDNDGDKDLFVANGHVYPQVDLYDFGMSYRETNQLFENRGEGDGSRHAQRAPGSRRTDGGVAGGGVVFTDVSASAGPGLMVKKVSRGACFGDYDNDGDLDIYIANLDDTPTLLRNDRVVDRSPPVPVYGDSPRKREQGSMVGNQYHWLIVKTTGVMSNRDGIGARVRVVTGTLEQIREIRAGDGFLSRSDPRAHFGLGTCDSADLVEVRWSSGTVDQLRDVAADQIITVKEKEGIVALRASR
ncbi:MAG: CRTAC1 family protein [Candidatus Latescibacteria bacterium]|nr:CRTAC1 family protein [Candidatus Latescibacterota bacterium]